MGGILLVLAHPDDECFMGGGALAHYARRGLPTALLTLTDGQAGRAGRTGAPPLATRDDLGRVRREELRRAAETLGIGELITPGWMDGALGRVDEAEAVAEVVRHVRRLRPLVTISFGPEGAPNNHADHRAVARWTEAAFDRAADPEYVEPGASLGETPKPRHHAVAKHYWITWPPSADHLRGRGGSPATAVIEVGPEIDQLKRQAFTRHATQQDFDELFNRFQDLLEGREYYHLSRSRVPTPIGLETDLLAGLNLLS